MNEAVAKAGETEQSAPLKVFHVPVNVMASITLKVLASTKEEAAEKATARLDGEAVFETSVGGLDVEYEDEPLSLDDLEIEADAMRESEDKPEEHRDWAHADE